MNVPDEFEDALLADGFEDAFVAFGTQFSNAVAIYDYQACVHVLIERDGMTHEEADEYLEFNTCGAWVGEHTPVFIRYLPVLDDDGR